MRVDEEGTVAARFSGALLTGRSPLRPEQPFQMIVDRELLADHRLALGDRASTRRLANRQHRRAGFVGIGAPVYMAAGRQHVRLIRLQTVTN